MKVVCDSFEFLSILDRINSKILLDYSNELKRYESKYSNMKSFEMNCYIDFLQLKFNFSFEELKFIYNTVYLTLYYNSNGNITIILQGLEVPEIRKQVKILYYARDRERQIKKVITVIKDAIEDLKEKLFKKSEEFEFCYGENNINNKIGGKNE